MFVHENTMYCAQNKPQHCVQIIHTSKNDHTANSLTQYGCASGTGPNWSTLCCPPLSHTENKPHRAVPLPPASFPVTGTPVTLQVTHEKGQLGEECHMSVAICINVQNRFYGCSVYVNGQKQEALRSPTQQSNVFQYNHKHERPCMSLLIQLI